MCGRRRMVPKLIVALSASGIVGCICTGVQPIQYQGFYFDGMDASEIDSLTRLTFDVNDYAQGNISADDLKARYERLGRTAEIRSLPAVQTSYLLLTDYVLRQHTIVLPGTINSANLASDLDMVLTSDEDLGILVHHGFQINAQAVRKDVKDSLYLLFPVRVTGFSLGGATAVLLGAYLRKDGVYISNITTFGQPKVTDAGGAQVLQKQLPILRFIAGDDPVTTFPGGEFAHCGDGVILLDGSNVVWLPFGSEQFDLFDQLVVPLNETTFQVHKTYVERVEAKMSGAIVEVPFANRDCYLGQF